MSESRTASSVIRRRLAPARYALEGALRRFKPWQVQPWQSLCREVEFLGAGADSVGYLYAEPLNAGDYASYRGLRMLVGLEGVELSSASSELRKLRRWLARSPSKPVFVGGGGLLQPCFAPMWEMLLESGAPFIGFGIGLNVLPGLRDQLPPALLRNIGSRARYLRVRDTMTAQAFLDAGVPRPSVGVCPAVNFLLARRAQCATHERASTLLHVVHSADARHMGLGMDALRVALRNVAGQVGLAYHEVDHTSGYSNSLLRTYLRSAVVFSSRLHGCIFSYALSVPFVALPLDWKVSAFVATHAPSAAVLSPADLSTASVEGALRKALEAPVPDPEPSARDNATIVGDELGRLRGGASRRAS